MLAEPRRRQKWTLNPRGNIWANDESKFGQKLMEKMGWEKGKVNRGYLSKIDAKRTGVRRGRGGGRVPGPNPPSNEKNPPENIMQGAVKFNGA